ncbi:hypothetical protein C8R46DRAFT_49255 [Mycena filopes]|nr:hypothetical protein C8R46DRAFT_49255 [Mycena filopes]
MFASLSIALLLVSSVTAQVNKLPDCAKGCATSAATKAQCALSDTSCLCKTTFASSVLQCAGTTSCSSQDQTEVSSILEAMCGPAVTASGSSASGSPLPSGACLLQFRLRPALINGYSA